MIRSGKPLAISGFTLLEVIVVVAIIGILVGFAGLSLNTSDRHAKIEKALNRLLSASEMAAQEALISGQPISVDIYENTYQFLRFESGEWRQHERRQFFNPYEFARPIQVSSTPDAADFDVLNMSMTFLPDGDSFLNRISIRDTDSEIEAWLIPEAGSYRIAWMDNENN